MIEVCLMIRYNLSSIINIEKKLQNDETISVN
jgi:hypothetical protein